MAFNISNSAKYLPNLLNNPFIKNNLATIVIIILVVIIGIKIFTNTKFQSALRRSG